MQLFYSRSISNYAHLPKASHEEEFLPISCWSLSCNEICWVRAGGSVAMMKESRNLSSRSLHLLNLLHVPTFLIVMAGILDVNECMFWARTLADLLITMFILLRSELLTKISSWQNFTKQGTGKLNISRCEAISSLFLFSTSASTFQYLHRVVDSRLHELFSRKWALNIHGHLWWLLVISHFTILSYLLISSKRASQPSLENPTQHNLYSPYFGICWMDWTSTVRLRM